MSYYCLFSARLKRFQNPRLVSFPAHKQVLLATPFNKRRPRGLGSRNNSPDITHPKGLIPETFVGVIAKCKRSHLGKLREGHAQTAVSGYLWRAQVWGGRRGKASLGLSLFIVHSRIGLHICGRYIHICFYSLARLFFVQKDKYYMTPLMGSVYSR